VIKLECDHKHFIKVSGGRYWVCDNNFCFLSDEEYREGLR